jgi:predicted AlkP superfamily phosphohydrolase/phosphomutase
MAKRVFVFGIDGIPLWLIEDAVNKGYLKKIGEYMEKGVYGNLLAYPPIHTPPNWMSAFTGVPPSVHGIMGFYYIDRNYEVKHYNSTYRKVDPIWVTASKYGKKVIAVNIPMTYPPDQVNGIMVSGDERYGPPTEKHVYPPEIYNLLREENYIIDVLLYDKPKTALEKMHNALRIRSRVTRKLMEKYEWDLTIIVYREPDYILHKFLGVDMVPGGDHRAKEELSRASYEVLSLLDEEFSRFLKLIDKDDYVLIMSDHGHKTKEKIFYINNLLVKLDLLRFKGYSTRKISLKTLRKYAFLRWLWYKIPEKYRGTVKSKFVLKFAEPDKGLDPNIVDWPYTKALNYTNYGGVKVNLIGRERMGAVQPAEYPEFIDKIVEVFRNYTDDEGRPVFRDIYTIKDDGVDYNDTNYPDIVVVPADHVLLRVSMGRSTIPYEDVKSTLDYDRPLYKEREVSGHIPEGMYIFTGPGILKGRSIDMYMADIAPIILYLLNTPIPTYYTGILRKELFEEEWLARHPPSYIEERGYRIKSRIRKVRKILREKKGLT